MKLCVTCLARTDMREGARFTDEVLLPAIAAPASSRARARSLDSLFDSEEEELPTTLYASSPRSAAAVRFA